MQAAHMASIAALRPSLMGLNLARGLCSRELCFRRPSKLQG